MPEKCWVDHGMGIRETVGEHQPQTPLLRKEFGEYCEGISRSYQLPIKFDIDPYKVYLAMREHWLKIVPEDYRTVWEGYVCEAHYMNGSTVQCGYMLKAWFFCYQVNMDKLYAASKVGVRF